MTSLVSGFSAAGCVPFSTSLITQYFDREHRGAAIGFFYWGIFLGYSMSFVLIIAVEELGWRPIYLITGIPGILLADNSILLMRIRVHKL